jgi:hypothetical protein
VSSEFKKQYSGEIKKKTHSKKHTSNSKNMNGAETMTDGDDSESGNTKWIEESGVDDKNGRRNDINGGAHERHRRYVLESGKYTIPGLQHDYFQPSNAANIRNLIRNRNRADLLQKLARTSKQESNIPVLLYKPHRHVGFEDVKEGSPVFNSDEYDSPLSAGTIYIRQNGESSDEPNQDYDYIDKDDHKYDEDKDILSETKYFYGPAEYFEIFHKSEGVADKKFVGYDGELSEAESIVLIGSGEQEEEPDDDDNDDKVTQVQGPTEEEDRKKKAATDSMLHKYFTETYKHDLSNEEGDFVAVRRERGKHKIDLKDISNKRMPVERKREYSDEVMSQIAPHINENPDSSIHTVKSRKAVINDHSLHGNDYESYVPVEEAEITRSSRKVKETVKEDNDQNLPINHKEESHISRTRSQEKGTYKMPKLNSEEDAQQSYGKSSNHELPSVSQGTARQSEIRVRKISRRVIYVNSDEDGNNSDVRSNYSKQSSKSSITAEPNQRESEGGNEHVESASGTPKQSEKYNVKFRLHNHETRHKTHQAHEEIGSSSRSEDDIEEKVMKIYPKEGKHEKAPYQFQQNVSNNKVPYQFQQNVSNNKAPHQFQQNVSDNKAPYQFQQNVSNNKDHEVAETDATVPNHKLTDTINLGHRKKSSRAPSNTYRTTGHRVTQNYVSLEGQSGEHADRYMGHSSRAEVTSSEAEERSGIDEEEEESTQVKVKPSKSRQKNQVTASPLASNREPRYRVRREMAPQLPVPVTSVEKGQKETEVQNKHIELQTVTDPTNAELQINQNKHIELQAVTDPTNAQLQINQNKHIELQTVTDPTNAELPINVRDVKENMQLETACQNVPTETIISLNEAVQWNNKINSNKDNNKEMKDNYINLEECEENSGHVHEDDGETALQMNKNTQHEMRGKSLDEGNHKESEGSETNSNRSLHYMGPEQLQNGEQGTGTSLMIKPSNDIIISSMKADALKMADITTYVDGDNKFHKAQDDALNMKMYEEQGTAVYRLPKAIAEHMNMQHHSANMDTGREDSLTEGFSENIGNIIVAEEGMDNNGEWKVEMPVKVVEFQHADESSLLQKEGRLSKIKHGSALAAHELIPEFVSARCNEEMSVSVPGQNELQWTQNQEINQREARGLRSSEGQSPEKENSREEVPNGGEMESHEETMQATETVEVSLEAGKLRPAVGEASSERGQQERVLNVVESLSGDNVSTDEAPKLPLSLDSIASSDSYDATAKEPSGARVQIVTNQLPDNGDITDRTDTNVPKSNHAVKQTMKSIHDKIMKAEDEIFKITDNVRGSRSAHQSPVDGDPDSYGLAQIGDIVPKQLKAEDEGHKHHVLGTEGLLKNIPYFMDGNVAVLYNDKETDNFNGNLDNFATSSIADNEDVSGALLRSPKHVGHLVPILPRIEKSRIHHVDNINGHARLAKTGHIKAELEKKRLERFHALAAQRAKLKEDLLKLKVLAAEGKLKLPHHIVRRYTTQDENIESLTSHDFLDGSSDHMKLQLPTVTKTEKIKAELEKKRLEVLHILETKRARLKEDLLKLKVTSKEGKLKLPHRVRRRDTTQAEHVEPLMPNAESKDVKLLISIQNKGRNGYSNLDNLSAESQKVRETNSELMPTKSLYVRDVKRISEYESKDLQPASHENKAANLTCLESLGNYLNEIINVEAEEGAGNNKIEDAQSEIPHDVNLKTNEIKKRFRTSANFMNSKHENNIDNGDNEQNIDTKIIPYELHKHVPISTYKPSYSKIRRYLYPPTYKQLAASSEEFTGTEYLNPVNNLGNASDHSEEINDSSKIFSIIFEEFPNISTKSIEISETTSNNTAITAEEIPKTATEFKKGITKHSKLPMSGDIMYNTDTENVGEPKVKNWKKESSLISKTHPKNELKYQFRTMYNAAALEQKPSDLETVKDTEENTGYSVVMGQNTENGDALYGQNSDNNQEENKQTAPTGNIHKFIKNVADRVVNIVHKLSPWNYFSY